MIKKTVYICDKCKEEFANKNNCVMHEFIHCNREVTGTFKKDNLDYYFETKDGVKLYMSDFYLLFGKNDSKIIYDDESDDEVIYEY